MFIRNPLFPDKLIQDLLAGHSNLFFPILSPKKKGKNAPHVAVFSPARYTLYVNTYSGVNIKSCAPQLFIFPLVFLSWPSRRGASRIVIRWGSTLKIAGGMPSPAPLCFDSEKESREKEGAEPSDFGRANPLPFRPRHRWKEKANGAKRPGSCGAFPFDTQASLA